MPKEVTYDQLIGAFGLSMTCKHDGTRRADGYEQDIWLCTIMKGPDVILVNFYTGLGLRNHGTPVQPEFKCVLDCLVSDALGYDDSYDFESWASEMGFNTDSRKAEKIYKACEEQSKKFKRFLGRERYEIMLSQVSRL